MQNKKKAVVPIFIPQLSQYVTKNVTPTIILTKNPKVLYFCVIIVNLYHSKKWLIFLVSDSTNPVAIGSGYSAETISPLFSERKKEGIVKPRKSFQGAKSCGVLTNDISKQNPLCFTS